MDDAPTDTGEERPPGRLIARLALATRPAFLTASVLPVLLGSAAGVRAGSPFDAAVFALALAAVVLAHAAANVLNDVYDDLSGADRDNPGRLPPFTGGSRFIQDGLLSRPQMAWLGLALIGLAAVPGLLLVISKGPAVLAFGAVGLGLGVAYSAPPLQLNARGLGEFAVALAFGVLPVTGAAWLQTGELGREAFLLSLPVAAWVGNVLVINEVPDAAADRRAGKRTLAVRLGPRRTRWLYLGLHGVAAAACALAVAAGVVPPSALAAPVLLALGGAVAARGISPVRDDARLLWAIKFTLATHAVGTLWLTGWTLAAGI